MENEMGKRKHIKKEKNSLKNKYPRKNGNEINRVREAAQTEIALT